MLKLWNPSKKQLEFFESKAPRVLCGFPYEKGGQMDGYAKIDPFENETRERLDGTGVVMENLREWLQENMPDGREKDYALTKLDECEMWAERAVLHRKPKLIV